MTWFDRIGPGLTVLAVLCSVYVVIIFVNFIVLLAADMGIGQR